MGQPVRDRVTKEKLQQQGKCFSKNKNKKQPNKIKKRDKWENGAAKKNEREVYLT